MNEQLLKLNFTNVVCVLANTHILPIHIWRRHRYSDGSRMDVYKYVDEDKPCVMACYGPDGLSPGIFVLLSAWIGPPYSGVVHLRPDSYKWMFPQGQAHYVAFREFRWLHDGSMP
jgi:hypothetical protein